MYMYKSACFLQDDIYCSSTRLVWNLDKYLISLFNQVGNIALYSVLRIAYRLRNLLTVIIIYT